MSPIAIASIVLVCVFGGALFGMFLRAILPEHHLSDESKDVVKLVTGLIATLAALVLGLMVGSAKNSFDAVNDGFRQSAARIIVLDRTLKQYGPETKELRELLRRAFAARIERLFPQDRSQRSTLGAAEGTTAVEGFQQRVRELAPENDAQRSLQAHALEIAEAVVQARWLAIEQEDNTIPTPFLVVLVFWLAAMFTSFGLFAPRNAIAIAVLFLGALSLSASVFLIEELNNPLDGFITISSAPMYKALALLGQ
ncbi:MAG: hypothetical protein ABW205_10085 [Burkholderiales bacterium]